MKKSHFKTFAYSLLSFICSTLIAKEFTIISLDDFGTIEAIKFQDESASQILSLKQYYPNRSFPVPENNLIHFYGIHSDTGASTKRPILRISFADQENDIIVFLRRDKDDPEKINTEFLINDVTSFPALSTMIINLSNNEVVAQLGDKIIKLPPNNRKLIPLSKNERGSFSKKVLFAHQEKDQSINYFFISHWRITAGRKMLCIIKPDDELDSKSLKEILL
jgi:hypothetical protein